MTITQCPLCAAKWSGSIDRVVASGSKCPTCAPQVTEIERDRGEYALDNPWVLNYDFGHVEILKRMIHP